MLPKLLVAECDEAVAAAQFGNITTATAIVHDVVTSTSPFFHDSVYLLP